MTAPALDVDRPSLPKAPSGIHGLDEVTDGGLPRGRATLVCGPAGSGKTLLAMQFLVRGITDHGEPGVFVAFEESPKDLAANVASMGYDLDGLQAQGMLVVDRVDLPYGELVESGEWDLDGLFFRIGAAIDAVGAHRVVIDTLETLFGAFDNISILRSELHRLFSWLKERGVTTVITGERGDGTLTRHGIEEYVSDCVIVLDNRVVEQSSTRRLRVLKYRGSFHGTNEYPFLIGRTGISVLPITTARPYRPVSDQRVSTGIARLDSMLAGEGYYRGTTVLVSGTAGTGKSTIAAQFCAAACARGERAVYFAFEEAHAEIVRNMASVGINLQQHLDAGLLQLRCSRPSLLGLENHLLTMQETVAEFDPAVVVIDPVSDLLRIASEPDVSAMLTRQIDFLKDRGITSVMTTLNASSRPTAGDDLLTSLVDTWLIVQSYQGDGEFNRLLYVRKSRGMAHSNQIREFLLTEGGFQLTDVYLGTGAVLTGAARRTQEVQEASEAQARLEDLQVRRAQLTRRRAAIQAQTDALWREFDEDAQVVEALLAAGASSTVDRAGERAEQGRLRRADSQ